MRAALHYTIDHFLLLPLGGALALLWANAAPEAYFGVAHALRFWVNDVGMTLFLALITQEIVEEVLPGGALHSWRRWLLPVVAGCGAVFGAAVVYLGYVTWWYEAPLRGGWPAAVAMDVAAVYILARWVFGRHPAVPFVLLVSIVASVVSLAFVASRPELGHYDGDAAILLLLTVALAYSMRLLKLRSFWPYVLVCGPMAWWALFTMGLNPALALVPIIPFAPHARRSLQMFNDHAHGPHDSPAHFEHVFIYPVHGLLFLFGLVNAGVLLAGYGTGTWAIVTAALVGKPLGLLAATGLGVAVGLHLPRGLHWADLIVAAAATAGGFAFALFAATAVYPMGPLLGELKLGVIISGVGVPLTVVLAWALRRGRFHLRPEAGRHVGAATAHATAR